MTILVGLGEDVLDYLFAAELEYFPGSLFGGEDVIKLVDPVLKSGFDFYFPFVEVDHLV